MYTLIVSCVLCVINSVLANSEILRVGVLLSSHDVDKLSLVEETFSADDFKTRIRPEIRFTDTIVDGSDTVCQLMKTGVIAIIGLSSREHKAKLINGYARDICDTIDIPFFETVSILNKHSKQHHKSLDLLPSVDSLLRNTFLSIQSHGWSKLALLYNKQEDIDVFKEFLQNSNYQSWITIPIALEDSVSHLEQTAEQLKGELHTSVVILEEFSTLALFLELLCHNDSNGNSDINVYLNFISNSTASYENICPQGLTIFSYDITAINKSEVTDALQGEHPLQTVLTSVLLVVKKSLDEMDTNSANTLGHSHMRMYLECHTFTFPIPTSAAAKFFSLCERHTLSHQLQFVQRRSGQPYRLYTGPNHHPKVRLAVVNMMPYCGYTRLKNGFTGISWDVMEEVAKLLEVEIEVVAVTEYQKWTKYLNSKVKDKIMLVADVAIGYIPDTTLSATKDILLTESYLLTHQATCISATQLSHLSVNILSPLTWQMWVVVVVGVLVVVTVSHILMAVHRKFNKAFTSTGGVDDVWWIEALTLCSKSHSSSPSVRWLYTGYRLFMAGILIVYIVNLIPLLLKYEQLYTTDFPIEQNESVNDEYVMKYGNVCPQNSCLQRTSDGAVPIAFACRLSSDLCHKISNVIVDLKSQGLPVALARRWEMSSELYDCTQKIPAALTWQSVPLMLYIAVALTVVLSSSHVIEFFVKNQQRKESIDKKGTKIELRKRSVINAYELN